MSPLCHMLVTMFIQNLGISVVWVCACSVVGHYSSLVVLNCSQLQYHSVLTPCHCILKISHPHPCHITLEVHVMIHQFPHMGAGSHTHTYTHTYSGLHVLIVHCQVSPACYGVRGGVSWTYLEHHLSTHMFQKCCCEGCMFECTYPSDFYMHIYIYIYLASTLLYIHIFLSRGISPDEPFWCLFWFPWYALETYSLLDGKEKEILLISCWSCQRNMEFWAFLLRICFIASGIYI